MNEFLRDRSMPRWLWLEYYRSYRRLERQHPYIYDYGCFMEDNYAKSIIGRLYPEVYMLRRPGPWFDKRLLRRSKPLLIYSTKSKPYEWK